jgi:hypothetical protein
MIIISILIGGLKKLINKKITQLSNLFIYNPNFNDLTIIIGPDIYSEPVYQ